MIWLFHNPIHLRQSSYSILGDPSPFAGLIQSKLSSLAFGSEWKLILINVTTSTDYLCRRAETDLNACASVIKSRAQCKKIGIPHTATSSLHRVTLMNSLHSFRHRIASRIVFIVLNINIVSLKITLVNLSFSVIIYNFCKYDLHRMLQWRDRYSDTVII